MRQIQILCEQYEKIFLKDLAFTNIGRANSMRVAGAVANANSRRNLSIANSNFERFMHSQKAFITGHVESQEDTMDRVQKSLEKRFGVK